MLVLTRKCDQRLMIGGDIVITVCEVRSDGSVRLGIDAPKDVPVHREEVLAKIESDKPVIDSSKLLEWAMKQRG